MPKTPTLTSPAVLTAAFPADLRGVANSPLRASSASTAQQDAPVRQLRARIDPGSGSIVGYFSDDQPGAAAPAQAQQDASAPVGVPAVATDISDDDITDLIELRRAFEKIASGMTVTTSDRLFDKSVRPRKMTIRDAVEIAQYMAPLATKLIERFNAAPAAPIAPASQHAQHAARHR